MVVVAARTAGCLPPRHGRFLLATAPEFIAIGQEAGLEFVSILAAQMIRIPVTLFVSESRVSGLPVTPDRRAKLLEWISNFQSVGNQLPVLHILGV